MRALMRALALRAHTNTQQVLLLSAINHTAFPQAPYKLPPSINNTFTRALFLFFVSNTFFLSFSSHTFCELV